MPMLRNTKNNNCQIYSYKSCKKYNYPGFSFFFLKKKKEKKVVPFRGTEENSYYRRNDMYTCESCKYFDSVISTIQKFKYNTYVIVSFK